MWYCIINVLWDGLGLSIVLVYDIILFIALLCDIVLFMVLITYNNAIYWPSPGPGDQWVRYRGPEPPGHEGVAVGSQRMHQSTQHPRRAPLPPTQGPGGGRRLLRTNVRYDEKILHERQWQFSQEMLTYVSTDMFCLVIWYDTMRVHSGRHVTPAEVSDIHDLCALKIGPIRVHAWYHWKHTK